MDDDDLLLQTFSTRPLPLRIALVTETYPPEINGVAMTLGRQVADLQQRGHQIQLVRPRQTARDLAASSASLEEVLKPGVAIPRYAGLKMGLPAKSALTRLWSLKRPDLVHIATEGPLGWSALVAANKLRIPVSTDFHTNFHSYSQHYGIGWLRRPILAYLRKFHNKSCVTLVPTEGIRRELQVHGYGNLEVVARGVDTELFSPAHRDASLRAGWGVDEATQVVLHVGRLAPEKNLNLVFAAFAAMHQCNPRTRLVLVGDGPDRATLQAAYPQAVFCGMRSGVDLSRHYASADVFLFPSLTETFGNVTIEAMASGLAVVAYNYAAAGELIRHNGSGVLAAHDDAEAFIAQAARLAADPALAQRMAQAARHAAQKMSWDSIHDRFEQVLYAIVAKEGRDDTTRLALANTR
ncbi:glycosyl transferase [Sulfuriferula plumbiphila]|uniref:Glycosyl transferase n=1 Tax=Sulfuriferula plumbiphila TaxID=171865 RepID=A0A512L4C4_9PROT|nr:glycosyltransferase family 1 protein [Sulfuriferula plumbiphila]BBP02757.1 glycosyl transferase [Sulfuriferula plumbiphila]GEP29051.1 glycosyl transferase [Sulfuriferula plumbiphila]